MSGLLGLMLTLAIFGLIAYLILNFIPMPPPVKTIIMAIMVIILIIWLLGFVGVGGGHFSLGKFGCN
jgi:hypothetical protein